MVAACGAVVCPPCYEGLCSYLTCELVPKRVEIEVEVNSSHLFIAFLILGTVTLPVVLGIRKA